jgi:N-acetylglucosamine-6-phosphate deacetylase
MNKVSKLSELREVTQLEGNILTPAGWVKGAIEFSGKVRSIHGVPVDPVFNQGHYILPGFVDLHVHGAGGKDIMDGGAAIETIARQLAQHGTTSMLATTMTAPMTDIRHALQGLAEACRQRAPGAARVLGVHLEGPYINPGKLGAQPDFALGGSLEQVRNLQAIAPIHVITMAPEIAGHLALVRELADMGIRVQLGHTLGSYEDAVAAMEQGASSFTHLYNAMSRLDQRAPGVVGAALAHAQFSEIIPDLLHVHPGAIKVALRAIPKLYCVTDSTSACGMPDGEYMLGRQVVHKCLGGVRLADGTLAGSTLTMDQALRNLVSIGLDLADASRRVSTYAADYLGLAERGRLQRDSYADLVVLDRDLHLIAVYAEGEKIELGS